MNDNMFQYGLDMNDMNRNHFDTLTHLNPYIEIKKKGPKIPGNPQQSTAPGLWHTRGSFSTAGAHVEAG